MTFDEARRIMKVYPQGEGAVASLLLDLIEESEKRGTKEVQKTDKVPQKSWKKAEKTERKKVGRSKRYDTKQILDLHAQGLNNSQIAKKLGCTPTTVASYIAAADILATE